MTKKIEAFWVDATAEDVARVAKGETVEARFRDAENAAWFIKKLGGWTVGIFQWYSTDDVFWAHCQVYREPSWYANKPDPGPAYRLLEKFPDEELKPGDELWMVCNKSWELSNNAHEDRKQDKSLWYRRRIEPVETTRQFDRRVALQVGDRVRHPSGFLAIVTEKGFEVTQ